MSLKKRDYRKNFLFSSICHTSHHTPLASRGPCRRRPCSRNQSVYTCHTSQRQRFVIYNLACLIDGYPRPRSSPPRPWEPRPCMGASSIWEPRSCRRYYSGPRAQASATSWHPALEPGAQAHVDQRPTPAPASDGAADGTPASSGAQALKPDSIAVQHRCP